MKSKIAKRLEEVQAQRDALAKIVTQWMPETHRIYCEESMKLGRPCNCGYEKAKELTGKP